MKVDSEDLVFKQKMRPYDEHDKDNSPPLRILFLESHGDERQFECVWTISYNGRLFQIFFTRFPTCAISVLWLVM